MVAYLREQGHTVNRKGSRGCCVARAGRHGAGTGYQQAAPRAQVYRYLLRGVAITGRPRSNHESSAQPRYAPKRFPAARARPSYRIIRTLMTPMNFSGLLGRTTCLGAGGHIRIALITILALGLVLRLSALFFGLPQQLDPDERLSIMAAGRMLGGDRLLDPQWYGWPGYTLHTLLAFSFAAFAALQLALGQFETLRDLEALFYNAPDALFVIGRLWGAISGTLCILATYMLAKRVLPRAWALAAATLVALSPTMLELSMLTRPDMLQILFMLLVMIFAIDAAEDPSARQRNFLLAGICLGLATASKYPGAVAVLAILIAVSLEHGITIRERAISLGIAAGASVASVFISAPYLVLNLSGVLRDLANEGREFHLSATSPGFIDALWQYLTNALPHGTSAPVTWLGYAGLLALFFGPRRHAIVIPSVFLGYLLFISVLNLYWERWVLPLIPLVAIGFVYIIFNVSERLSARVSGKQVSALAALIIVLAVVPLLSGTVSIAMAKAQNRDPRVVAYDWLMDNLPRGSSVLLESYTPQLSVDDFRVLVAREGSILSWADAERSKRPPGYFGSIGGGLSTRNHEFAVEELRVAGVEYVVVDGWYDRYRNEAALSARPGAQRIVDIYESIFAGTVEVQRFAGGNIRVLRVTNPGTE
jgi:hypothetical protein